MAESRFGGEAEQRLIEAIQEGKQEAFGLLYDAFAPVLMGLISRMVPEPHIAEEVLKETFLTIWSRIHIYDPSKSRFLTWALAIGRGVSLEALKTGKYCRQNLGSEEGQEESETISQVSLPNENRVFANLGHLETEGKAIIDLIYLKGYRCAQAAEALGISEEQLKSRLVLAFKHLGAEKTA
ncbi:RNA polymerase sigma factor [Rufibacter latericius]|uniref:Sigma-70 family RNA polymerase sigma factor n=1 Tax=Rufibacter latericius TaxID=2487040 RepID=A0A3M9MVH7_9BACT|nr:sigma-70 family RNA polymerase sigma factor [Rufibacter latericius]RNI29137.1 sigma-70 family RNA polymerase sigma factor [Rufibacter latericius]